MPYWLVLVYRSRDDARKAFEAYRDAGVAVLLFEEQSYPPELFAVAAYADDETHLAVSTRRPRSVDSYMGLPRLLELYRYYLLIDAANVPSKNIDEVISYTTQLRDTF